MTPQGSKSYYRWVLLALPLLFGAGAVVVLYCFNPVQYSFYPVCAFHRLTGLYCPGCGAQRALHSLLHGEVLAALHFNPLLILALPFLAFAGARFLWREATGTAPTPIVVRPFWIILLAGLVIAFGILRNIPCAPFTYLAPP